MCRLDDGRVVFVAGVLPDETVEVEIIESKRDFARGRILSVVEASPRRREPPCGFVETGCGGCDWQHIDRHHQGQLKRAIVAESFARTGRIQIEPEMRRLPEAARRTTVRMVADPDGALGFRARDSHEVVAVGPCMVSHEMINQLIATPVLDGAGEVSIRVGARTGQVALWCHEGSLVENLPANVKVGQRARITEVIGEASLSVSMGSFFQSSPEAAELIIDSVARRLDAAGVRGGVLVDAYAGVGLFSVAFAQRFDSLHLVESSASACRDAVRNLADCAAVIEQADMNDWDPIDADVVVADPSRSGLGARGARAIVETGAPHVVLVSCDPVAAARDARLLIDAGYHIGECEVLDIFPETHHIEVVTSFSR